MIYKDMQRNNQILSYNISDYQCSEFVTLHYEPVFILLSTVVDTIVIDKGHI